MDSGDLQSFETYRQLMFSIAYRMMASATDAEDIVQEAYLRYQAAAPETITSPKAFLSTVVTRLCLNQLQSARSRRETYLGPWLPEPVLTEQDERFLPAKQAERAESLSLAFLVLLEHLSPQERAVYLLRQVFEYDYAEIATVMEKEESACRQMFSRARKHIRENRPRYQPAPEELQRLLEQFTQAVSDGDLSGLIQLLSGRVTLWADGGGKARGAALRPLHGRKAVAQFVLASVRLLPDRSQAAIAIAEVNGEPALVIRSGDQVLVVLSVETEQGKIQTIRAVANPDKLRWVERAAHSDMNDLGDGERN